MEICYSGFSKREGGTFWNFKKDFKILRRKQDDISWLNYPVRHELIAGEVVAV